MFTGSMRKAIENIEEIYQSMDHEGVYSQNVLRGVSFSELTLSGIHTL